MGLSLKKTNMMFWVLFVVSIVSGLPTEKVLPITEDSLHPTSSSMIEKDLNDVTELLRSHEAMLEQHQYQLPPSAVVVTSSVYTTNNPLDNLKDFTTWVPADVHDFYLSSENNVEGNEFGFIDQLALESDHNPGTVITFTLEKDIGHADLHEDSQGKEEYEPFVSAPNEVSTTTSYSVSSTSQVWITDEDFILPSTNTPNHHEDIDDTTLSLTAENTKDVENYQLNIYNVNQSVSQDISTTDMNDLVSDTTADTDSLFGTEVGVTETISQTFKSVSLEENQEIFPKETDIVYQQTNSDDGHEFILAKLQPKEDYFELYEESKNQTNSQELNDENVREENKEKPSYNSDLYDVVTSQPDNNETPELTSEIAPKNKETSSIEPANIDDFEIKYENLLKNLKEKYGFPSSNIEDVNLPENPSNESPVKHREHPLLTLTSIEPHAMMLLVKPRVFHPGTMVRLMYERVPRKKSPLLQHLDDPVIEYVPLYRPVQEHELSELPMGKYIVCGEAQLHGQVQQANCFETLIDRHDTNSLQSGVVGIIVVALLIVFSVILFVVYHKLMGAKKERKLEDKLDMVAKKKKEDELSSIQEDTDIYPQLSDEYEERCIM